MAKLYVFYLIQHPLVTQKRRVEVLSRIKFYDMVQDNDYQTQYIEVQ